MSISDIGVIFAIFFGICALGISIWQGYETRKNYRLSVTPNITIYGRWIIGPDLIGITLENKGIGPAVITTLEIVIAGQIRNIIDHKENFLIANKISEQTGIEQLCYSSIDSRDFIAAGEKRNLFWIEGDEKNNVEKVKRLRRFFWETTLRVEYESVYGQKYSSKDYNAPQE